MPKRARRGLRSLENPQKQAQVATHNCVVVPLIATAHWQKELRVSEISGLTHFFSSLLGS